MATRQKERSRTSNGKRTRRRVPVAKLRKSYGVTRDVFARLSGYSVRSLASWETGGEIGVPARQRMNELARLHDALCRVIEPSAVSEWLQTPNDAFGGLKPLEVIERGEADRIWRMIYQLESGMPA